LAEEIIWDGSHQSEPSLILALSRALLMVEVWPAHHPSGLYQLIDAPATKLPRPRKNQQASVEFTDAC
jgi:hypothetical protein